ncbi:uncharacterized protein Z520_02493 [Fonsecaea multimorphosa CBS 102226]|uniref:Glycosyltransferase 2-like domain-containing protein n=1 Tax=Fonsecaea multimorphosa CBS 102226 TaxID=1442371 RepID=A0A0D2KFX7_9EURO|nr:uncharacterized protein Z520_02493 [Fonsecaea multimorphosa CBS 102226]KIY02355.1 hypothetical protein Z520_02493 [Fonsecaea multimorphosa CBS 102226]OAL28999.1 hypothetical protein AYO22_02435 [Fonsecaea multimorphosa]
MSGVGGPSKTPHDVVIGVNDEDSNTSEHLKWTQSLKTLPSNASSRATHHSTTCTSSQPHEIRRRLSHVARRASVAIADVAHKVDPLAVTEGNPLGLAINEIRGVSSTGYSAPGQFDARRYSCGDPNPPAVAFPEPARISQASDPSSDDSTVRPGMSEKVDDYLIQRLAKHDDIERLSRLKRLVYRLRPILIIFSAAANWLYFAFRVKFTLDAEHVAHRTFWMAWAFIIIECCLSLPIVMDSLWGFHITGRRKRPKLRLVGDNVPSVDVVITCCREEDDLILDTAKAACNIDYPRERFRVLVCDDGKSESLRNSVEKLALTQFPNLYYRSRPKFPGVPHHFKAGNLNDALEATKKLPNGAANFFAALDADMIPMRDWLRALLPHMLQDPKCSMACPPQLFYNVPKDDPLCQSLDTFVHNAEPIKDSLGVAWCTGSGYVFRRSALTSIGGFPTGSLAEDVCCSSMLLGSGWNTAFVHEPLQFGTVPDSLQSHLKQRTRWTIGTIQTAVKLRFSLFGPRVKHMTTAQRLCGFVYTMSSLFTVFLVASLFTAPVVLISSGTLVPYADKNQLRWLVRAAWLTVAVNRVNEMISFLPSGYRTGQRDNRARLWMSFFHAIAVVRTFLLPKWLGGKVAVFTSSGSQKDQLNERNPQLRAPLFRRLKVVIWDCQCYLHVLYITFILAAVILSLQYNLTNPVNTTTKKFLIDILTHSGWPPLIWMTCGLSCWAPISYAIFPPSMPDREDLLNRDPVTGVAYPKEEAKKTQTSWIAWFHESHYTFITIYTTVVMVLSFWIE